MSDMSAKTKNRRLTAVDIHRGMAAKWTAPEWAIMWEVGEATGSMAGRYADAVMMSLWPSRGLELHGVEVKVSRSDWKREAADPRKAEAVGKFCDRWWIHTPPGIVADLSDVPPAWGLREFDGKVWKTLREAEKTEAAPTSRGFLAAMLRRADGMIQSHIREGINAAREADIAREGERRERYLKDVEEASERKTRSLGATTEKLAKFEAAFGKGVLQDWTCDPERLGKIARAVERAGLIDGHNGLQSIAERLRKQAESLDEALTFFSEPTQ